MTLRVFEGFDQISTSNTIAATQLTGRGWASVSGAVGSGASTPGLGRFGGRFLAMMAARWDGAAVATGVVGTAIGINIGGVSPTGLPWRLIEVMDGASVQIGVGLDAGMHFFIYRNTTATVLATGTTVMPTNSWIYAELKATIHNTTGAYELRLNGSATPELIASGVNTRNTANNQLTGFSLPGNSTGFSVATSAVYDDVYHLDTSGAAPFADFLGEIRVQTLNPSAAGSSTQWTPLSSTNVSNIDDQSLTAGMDSDATYNSSATSGQIDLFACQDLTGTPTVLAVAVGWDARKDDAGTRQVRAKVKSGAATGNGTTRAMGSSYTSYQDVFLTDPNTGAAWTSSAVNALEAGYENI